MYNLLGFISQIFCYISPWLASLMQGNHTKNKKQVSQSKWLILYIVKCSRVRIHGNTIIFVFDNNSSLHGWEFDWFIPIWIITISLLLRNFTISILTNCLHLVCWMCFAAWKLQMLGLRGFLIIIENNWNADLYYCQPYHLWPTEIWTQIYVVTLHHTGSHSYK